MIESVNYDMEFLLALIDKLIINQLNSDYSFVTGDVLMLLHVTFDLWIMTYNP